VKVGNADFCGYIWQKPAGRSQCIATVGRVKNDGVPEDGKPTRFDCFSGCRYVVQTVLYEGDPMGRVVFGPFTPDDLVQLPRTLTSISEDFDEKLAQGYMQKIRRVPQPTADKIVKHFAEILDVLVFSGHKNLVTARLHIEAVQESYRELEEKNKQLEESFSKLKELDRLKSNFLATMSHELRTPLNAIIGFSDMLSNDSLALAPAREREYAKLINESGKHLLSVVNGILDMSKMESGNFEITPEPFAPAQAIKSCCDLLALKSQEAGVELKMRIAADLPELVADRRAVNQILINLISNAIKFTPRGGSVRVSAVCDGSKLAVTVEDTGVGIGETDLPHLGKAFFQARASYDRRHDGTGLGLSIVKGLVRLHGGDLDIRSRLGDGTQVTVRLPIDCEGIRPAVEPIQLVTECAREFAAAANLQAKKSA